MARSYPEAIWGETALFLTISGNGGIGGGGRGGLNLLEKLCCPVCSQISYPKLLSLCPLTSFISSADHCFPFFTSHLCFAGHTVFCMAFFFPLEAKLKGLE